MIESGKGGSIVNVSSIASLQGLTGHAVYGEWGDSCYQFENMYQVTVKW